VTGTGTHARTHARTVQRPRSVARVPRWNFWEGCALPRSSLFSLLPLSLVPSSTASRPRRWCLTRTLLKEFPMIRMCISIQPIPNERTNEHSVRLPPRIIYSWDLACAIDSLPPAPDRLSVSPWIFSEGAWYRPICVVDLSDKIQNESWGRGKKDHRYCS